MDRLKLQEKPDNVASRDVCNKQLSCHASNYGNSGRNAIHTLTMSGEPSYNDLNRNSNSIDCETTVLDTLLRRFVLALNAKEVTGPRGCRTFALHPGVYAKTLESLRESDYEVWEYVSEELR